MVTAPLNRRSKFARKQQRLADAGIHIPIMFMTGHGDVPMSVRAMKAGAVDFLNTAPVFQSRKTESS